MNVLDRGQRLRMEMRLAILENITSLNRGRKEAVQVGNADDVNKIQISIDELYEQLDVLSFLSLQALEESDEVRRTISGLRSAADELEDEADTIKSVADALLKGAKIVDQVAKVVKKIAALIPA